MSTGNTHKHSGSISQNQKAQLANAYNELGKELSSSKIRVVGNYTLGRVIGEGAYGKVRMGTHRLTSTRVAIKQIPKSVSATLTREIHHHRQLHHPNITQMYEVIATESSVWIVTELCSGGELFDYLVEKGRLSEEETKVMFGQLCLAVAYTHEKGIVHRDLKLENVLLDERCRVKLGDFGFTREFERGALMETFCGTTGYAAPEMLQGKKYTGPEVDVWSLGVIMYTLLTGTLPFDDDDESVMRDKIIRGEFEDPEWLSIEARDLLQSILTKDTSKRFTISQILSHTWFTTRPTFQEDSPDHLSPIVARRTPSPVPEAEDSALSSEASNNSDTTCVSSGSSPSTPPDLDDPFIDASLKEALYANASQTTIRKSVDESRTTAFPETVFEEDDAMLDVPSAHRRSSSSSRAPPPTYPARTPARTKRRSMSSTLSDPDAPEMERTPTFQTMQQSRDIDFQSLLSTPAPIIFSTPLERDLLNNLSNMGFDLGQIVYSVLNDACDASGALWWILKRKAERKLLEEGEQAPTPESPAVEKAVSRARARNHISTSTQTETQIPGPISVARAPMFALVPPTPTMAGRPSTPPQRPTVSPASRTLTPTSSMIIDQSRSPPGSLKEKEIKGRKGRAGSVSIMQRATTALEAAGLVRKKSSDAIDKEREKERKKEEDKERKRTEEADRKSQNNDDPRSSNGSGKSSIKSPPLSSHQPSTPPPTDISHQVGIGASPWVLADSRSSSPQPRDSAASPPGTLDIPDDFMPTSASAPDFGQGSSSSRKGAHGANRNRANILSAFRLWFNEDRKGKRKDNAIPVAGPSGTPRPAMGPQYSSGSMKRRTSEPRVSRFGRGGKRRNRGSVSSRRSSSVNSRRSSINSVQMVVMDSPSVLPGRRSFGAHTPNSERDHTSRPSSVRSFSLGNAPRHRKSPSVSSAGSARLGTASPSIQKYHRRGGSGSSTRVVRQASGRPMHVRSNSTTSSIHSPTSSRPTSYHEYSDDGGYRTGSPFRPHSRRSMDSDMTPRKGATYVKRSAYLNGGSMSRSSWKKSWGLEPPGWQTRTAHHPVEVLSISPPAVEGPASLRDVFSGRPSLSLGDESDWVDEDDDDLPSFAGGLGQITHPSSSTTVSSMSVSHSMRIESAVTLSSPPSRRRQGKRAGKGREEVPAALVRKHSGSGRTSPVERETVPEARGSRRQLPPGRSGPAFKLAIQEEEEEEEE
ncbi:Pkinase-domain-containing protein [Cylindrobasidium torrendii FP15055 ss-10]|uniref:Pkinase-domain-containing protein n=1 Tax=Cylindrobasidium torrendii FP15055 ss-10 TaxID=1314674 RepID=A0A0D7BRS3_9AGAR|nr:Pkinase-domain-containing protein [Cylindrobasidium torrendii FP15055 ss-10]